MSIGLIFMLIMSLVISLLNAWSCGKSWTYTKSVGGWSHLLNWAGAVMSACGFTYLYMIPTLFIGESTGWLPLGSVNLSMKLGYIIIMPAVTISGLLITIQSWINFKNSRSFGSGALAAYNTYAQINNTMSAVSFMPAAVRDVYDSITDSGGEKENSHTKLIVMAVMIVLGSLVMGVLTTRYIILKTSKSELLE
jgi:hypothetical protein